jgi:hypothetical protein
MGGIKAILTVVAGIEKPGDESLLNYSVNEDNSNRFC